VVIDLDRVLKNQLVDKMNVAGASNAFGKSKMLSRELTLIFIICLLMV
jgi:hypothetical protein